MGSRYLVTETERTLQYRALRPLAKRISTAPDPKKAGHEYLQKLLLLIGRNRRNEHGA